MVAGRATDDEAAAVAAVLSAVLATRAQDAVTGPPASSPQSVWADRRRLLPGAGPHARGPSAWRRSALPR